MKIEITCTRRVRFSKTVEITNEKWDSLENQNDDGILNRADISELEGLIDFRADAISVDDYEDIEIGEVDDEGNAVKGGNDLCCY